MYPETTQLSQPDTFPQEGVNSAQQSSGLLAQAPVYQMAVSLYKHHHHVGGHHTFRSQFHPELRNIYDWLLWSGCVRISYQILEPAAAGAVNTAASPDDD